MIDQYLFTNHNLLETQVELEIKVRQTEKVEELKAQPTIENLQIAEENLQVQPEMQQAVVETEMQQAPQETTLGLTIVKPAQVHQIERQQALRALALKQLIKQEKALAIEAQLLQHVKRKQRGLQTNDRQIEIKELLQELRARTTDKIMNQPLALRVVAIGTQM